MAEDERAGGASKEVKDVSAEVAAAAAVDVAAQEAVSEPVDPQELDALREETAEVQDYMGIGRAQDPELEEAAKRLAEAAEGDSSAR